MLKNDIRRFQDELVKIIPNAKSLRLNKYKALVSMICNLGTLRFKSFEKMIRAAELAEMFKKG